MPMAKIARAIPPLHSCAICSAFAETDSDILHWTGVHRAINGAQRRRLTAALACNGMCDAQDGSPTGIRTVIRVHLKLNSYITSPQWRH